MTHSLRTTTRAMEGLSDWRITSQYGDSFGNMAFRFKVVYIISVQREDYDSKVFLKMDNFWSTCPKASIKDGFKVSWSWDLCFWSLRGFWQAWSCSKSWCIPNYQLSISFKTHHFLLPDFRKNREQVSESGILWPVAWVGMIKWFIRFFQNRTPRGIKFFFK